MQGGRISPLRLQEMVKQQSTAGTLLAIHEPQPGLPQIRLMSECHADFLGAHNQSLLPPSPFHQYHLQTGEHTPHAGQIIVACLRFEHVQTAAVSLALGKTMQAIEAPIEQDR